MLTQSTRNLGVAAPGFDALRKIVAFGTWTLGAIKALELTGLVSLSTITKYREELYQTVRMLTMAHRTKLLIFLAEVQKVVIRPTVAGAIALASALAASYIRYLEHVERAMILSRVGDAPPLRVRNGVVKDLKILDNRLVAMVEIDGLNVPCEVDPKIFASMVVTSKAIETSILDVPRKEMALRGSTIIPSEHPKYVLSVRSGVDHVGMGFRINNFLATALHVLQECNKSAEPTYLVGSNNRSYLLEKPFPVAMFTDLQMDLVLLSIPQPAWAALGITASKLTRPVSGRVIKVFGFNSAGMPSSARGTVLKAVGPMIYQHTASSVPGWSGSPIVDDNKIVGIHTGNDGDKNLATALDFLPASKEDGAKTPSPQLKERLFRERTEEQEADAEHRAEQAARVYDLLHKTGLIIVGSSAYSAKEIGLKGEDWNDMVDDDEYADDPYQDETDLYTSANDPVYGKYGALKGAVLKPLPRNNESGVMPSVLAPPTETTTSTTLVSAPIFSSSLDTAMARLKVPEPSMGSTPLRSEENLGNSHGQTELASGATPTSLYTKSGIVQLVTPPVTDVLRPSQNTRRRRQKKSLNSGASFGPLAEVSQKDKVSSINPPGLIQAGDRQSKS